MGQLLSSPILTNPEKFGTPLPSLDHEVPASCKSYDVVIVGGGTAGCVLASRLTEDPSIHVLLAEAGQSHKGNIFSAIPLAWAKLFDTDSDWHFSTIPQKYAGNRPWYWPRGKILGGSSSTNASIYHRCSPEDFEAWTKAGAVGWSYDEMKKYFLKSEGYIHHKEKSADNFALMHGTTGVSTVTHCDSAPIMDKVIEACERVGVRKTKDANTDEGTLGVAYLQGSVDVKSRRVSAATAYLTDKVLARSNLTVAVGVTAETLLTTVSGPSTSVNGVVFAQKRGGPLYAVRARKEVIVTSGAIGTPQVLMQSGIGPASVLRAKGIKLVQDLPLVGRNLLDHISAGPLIMRAQRRWTWDYLFTPFWSTVELVKWLLGIRGPMGSIAAQVGLFARSDDPRLSFGENDRSIQDLTSGHRSPDIEIFFAPTVVVENGSKPPPPGEYGITAGPIVLKPASMGTVEPASSSIWDGPLIDANYLSDRNDLKVLIKATKLAMNIARSEPLVSCLELKADSTDVHSKFWPADADPRTVRDDDLEEWIKRNGSTAFHPTSTAKIGPSAENSVVDSTLKVHGVNQLRVVDASVFPTQVSGHTCAVVIALAERAADLIKQDFASK